MPADDKKTPDQEAKELLKKIAEYKEPTDKKAYDDGSSFAIPRLLKLLETNNSKINTKEFILAMCSYPSISEEVICEITKKLLPIKGDEWKLLMINEPMSANDVRKLAMNDLELTLTILLSHLKRILAHPQETQAAGYSGKDILQQVHVLDKFIKIVKTKGLGVLAMAWLQANHHGAISDISMGMLKDVCSYREKRKAGFFPAVSEENPIESKAKIKRLDPEYTKRRQAGVFSPLTDNELNSLKRKSKP